MDNSMSSSCLIFKNGRSKEAHDMLDDALALASVGVAALKMLESLLPSAACNVEEATKSLSNHFMHLADSSTGQCKLIQDLLKKLEATSTDKSDIDEFRKQAEHYSGKVKEAIADVVMTMQFQDRNTQITDNAARVLQRYGTMLADIRDRITIARAGESSVDDGVSEAARHILSGICISDIRKHFIDALAEVNLQYATHHVAPVNEHSRTETVELF